jgi:hypothetical protein
VGWIQQAQDKNQWLALLNTAVNPWVPKNAGNPLLVAQLLGFEEGSC